MRTRLAWLAALALFGCAKAYQTTSPAAAPALAPLPPSQPDNPDAELLSLEGYIDQSMLSLGLAPRDTVLSASPAPSPPEPGSSVGEPISADSVVITEARPYRAKRAERAEREAEARFRDQQQEEQHQVCALTKSICDAAGRVCEIASRLPPESGAGARCERAKEACARAQDRSAPYQCQ